MMRKRLEIESFPKENDRTPIMTRKAIKFEITMQFDQLNRLKTIFNQMSSNFTPGEFVRVRIINSVSPQEFYVVKWQAIEDIFQLQSNLFECYSGKIHAAIAAPENRTICCVEVEGAWYRAIIDEIGKKSTCKVRLIDAGVTTWTTWSKLRILEEEFARFPAFSAMCKMSDSEVTKTQTEWFNEFCDDSKDTAIFINSISSDGCCEVELYSSNGSGKYKHINRTNSPTTKCTSEDNEMSSQTSSTASIGRSRPHMIEIMHMSSLQSIYIEFEHDKAGIQKLLRDVQRYACSLPEDAISDCEWHIDDHCVVQAQRPNKSPHYWYRGKIVAVVKNAFDVYLRDEGVTVTVNDRLRIRPISDRLRDVRHRAIQCCLSGVKPIRNHDVEDVVKDFMHIVSKFDRLAISLPEEPQNRILPILLWGGKMKYDENSILRFKWTNINVGLVNSKLAKKGGNFELIDIEVNDESKVNDRIAIEVNNELENVIFVGEEIGTGIDFGVEPAIGHDEYYLSDEIQNVTGWLPAEEISKANFVAIVTHIGHKCEVHVLDAYRQSVAETMQKRITEHVAQQKASTQNHNTDWIKEVGQPCFVRFKDHNYYRGEIRRIVRKDDNCLVRFIDYGNIETCKMRYIYPAVLFGAVPTLTQKYIFAHIRPNHEKLARDELGRYMKWPKDVIDYCRKELVDERCIIRVVDDFSGGVNTCELFKGKNDIEFGAKLVREYMASFIDFD